MSCLALIVVKKQLFLTVRLNGASSMPKETGKRSSTQSEIPSTNSETDSSDESEKRMNQQTREERSVTSDFWLVFLGLVHME